jgi:hypothetical protein
MVCLGELLWTKPKMSFAPLTWSDLWGCHVQVQVASIHNIVRTNSFAPLTWPDLWGSHFQVRVASVHKIVRTNSFAPLTWSDLWGSHVQVQVASDHNIVRTNSYLGFPLLIVLYLFGSFPNLWVVVLASPAAVIAI